MGHEVLGDSDVEAAAERRWGQAAFGDDGHIDRSSLARIVFAPPPNGPRELAYLEQLTHPRIAERLRRHIERARARGETKAIVLDAAVLLKAGWDRFCDRIVFIDTPCDLRRQRARQRGWTDDEFAARQAAQPPLATQRELADAVIDNSTSGGQILSEIRRFWTSLSE
jgi:dephospho-CoA kinase